MEGLVAWEVALACLEGRESKTMAGWLAWGVLVGGSWGRGAGLGVGRGGWEGIAQGLL